MDPNYWRDPASGNAFQIQVEIPQNKMQSIAALQDLPVMLDGKSRPLLADVADVKYGSTMGEVDRYNMQRVVSLTANIHGKILSQAAAEVRAAIQRAGAPPKGVTVAVRGQIPPLEETIGGWHRHDPAQRFADLAESKGWWDLWSASIRASTNAKLFNERIGRLMRDEALSDETRRKRLRALAGVSREWNWPRLGLAIIHRLDDELACLVYARYPDLIRGPLRANVTPRWWRGYPSLVKAAQAAHDDDLVDTLASRYAVRISWTRPSGGSARWKR